MKYLNEAKHISELQEICREHLIDLVDKGFNVDMSYHGYLIIDKLDRKTFEWNEVADSIINFIEVFSDELSIHDIYFKYFNDDYNKTSLFTNTDGIPYYASINELESIDFRNISYINIKMEMTK